MLKLEEKVGVDEHFQYRSKSHLEVKKIMKSLEK